MKLLLEVGADVNAADAYQKQTALMWAASEGHTDVIKALALGATACLIGRPQLWGLACAGEAGVARVLELLRLEIDRTMALGGWDRIRAGQTRRDHEYGSIHWE